ncbi:hypothetical protein [Agrobacterium vitis]|uniref:Uncharacterized protein n=1 Tax=Agrobacterium vitis TaxID=373 RepID=A0AAE2RE19_AGRVI|nr:hypothetical protein [Agrobacterium vitis]MBF2716067.1 hypothetical protein [Agrobacterium vitis]
MSNGPSFLGFPEWLSGGRKPEIVVNRRGKLTPYRRPMLTPVLTISTWIARRWPGLQRAKQVRVMGLFGFSFESGF